MATAIGGWSKAFDFGAAQKASKATDSIAKSLGKMGTATATATKGTGAARAGLTTLASEAGVSGGAIGGVTKMLSKLGPEGMAAAAALVAVTAAVTVTVGSLLAMAAAAIEVVQARAGLLATFAALGGGAVAGAAVLAMVDDLSTKMPFASDQIAGWAKSLESAGLSGDKLRSAVTAVAAATALMGEQGGAAAQKMIEQLAEGGMAASKMMKQIQEGSPKSARLLADMGLRIEDVAAAAGMSVKAFKAAHMSADAMNDAITKALAQKSGGAFAEMAMTWPVIINKVKEGFASVFEKLGPAVKPFMKAVQQLFGQFGRGTPAIKALQKIATEVFGALFKWATMAVKAVSAFIKTNLTGAKIGAVWKGIKSAVSAVLTVLAPVGHLLMAVWKNAFLMNGIKTIFKTIGIAILVVVAIVGAVILAFVTMAGIVGAVLGAVAGVVGGAIDALAGLAGAAWDAASAFISGLLGGITGGAGAIVDAVKNIASSALGAFKSVLGIASPSKVMASMGGHFATGAAEGIDAGAPKVAASAGKLGAGAAGAAGAGAGGGKAGGKSGKSVSVTIAAGAVVIHAGGATITEEGLAMALERLLAAQGMA